MPFGVRNAPAVFQALMTKLLSDCKSFSSPYMDDVVIYSGSWTEHKVHIREVLSKVKGAVTPPSVVGRRGGGGGGYNDGILGVPSR